MPRGEKSRTALVEHGTQLMLRSGYAGTGLGELLQVAGVPKGSFYNHFESKDELLKVLVTHAVDAHGRAIDGLMAEESDNSKSSG